MRPFLYRFPILSVAIGAAIALAGVGLGHLTKPLQARPLNQPVAPTKAPLLLANGQAVTNLAKHLKKVGAKMYGAYWCPHCKHQIELFGTTAFQNIDYVECDPRGEKARPQLCSRAKIQGYPTWEIKGKKYMGVQSLEELAKASGYQGPTNF